MSVDFSFNYKNNIRFLMIQKYFYSNLYVVESFSNSVFFFSIREYDSLEYKEIYNFFYLFKFFFGKLALFSSYKKYFKLGKWYYDFEVRLIVNKLESLFYIYFLFNDLFKHYSKSVFSLSIKADCLYIQVLDMNIFGDKKSNLGLFNIRSNLVLKFMLNTNNELNVNNFFKSIKICYYV